MCSWDYDICSGAIMWVVMIMVFAAGAVMFAVVLLRGNFSVGTSTMSTHYEKAPPWELSLWAFSVGTLHEKTHYEKLLHGPSMVSCF